MILAGLPLATLAGIFAAVGALVVGLYILKLRRRTVAVPFSPLWQRILRDKEATSLFSRLKRVLSLLLQLAILGALCLALGDPRAAATLIKGRTLVVLLDASASMQATDVSPSALGSKASEKNRLGVAKEEVRAMIRGLGGADRMLIAQMDASVSAVSPMSGDTSELERTLDQVHATDARADFPRALRFATDALRGVERSEIVVVSDGRLGPAEDALGPVHLGDTQLSYVKIGSRARNVGITEFSVRRYPLDKSRYEVMLEVANTGPEPEEIELSLLGDGQVVDLTRLRLRPGERLPRFYPSLSGANRTLEAKLAPLAGSEDNLPADNRAYALLPERHRAKVLVVTEGNTYLEAALLLDEYLDVTQTTPLKYAASSQATKYDVVIFDRATPAEMPRAHVLYLDPTGPGSPVKVEGVLEQPGFDKIDRKHPIVHFTALDDVNIARGHKLVPQAGDKVIGASEGGNAILIGGARGGHKFVALGFDPRDSDLPLRVAWPLFLLDTINWFVDDDASYLSSLRTGDVWRVPVEAAATQAKLRLPSGATQAIPVHEGSAVYLGQSAGFYEIDTGAKPDSGDRSTKAAFAANLLDEAESSIAPSDGVTVDGKRAGELSSFHVGVRREVWLYLLLAALLVTIVEWGTYHRRLTV